MIQRSAVGRVGCMGELYDARSDSLASLNLFKSTLPSNFVSSVDTSRTDFEYKITKSLSDKLELLDVGGELQLSIACGIVSISGAGNYIKSGHTSKNTVACSLLCNTSTVTEKLTVTTEELLPHLDVDALENDGFTHVIVQIDWGANCILSLEQTCESESDRSRVEGRLNAHLGHLLKMLVKQEGKAQGKSEKSAEVELSGVSIKVSADVVAEEELPTTVEGFCRLVKDLPRLLAKVGGGKGKPLKYGMMPLSELRKSAKMHLTAEAVYKAVDESFLISITYFLDEVEDLKLRFKDLVESIDKNRKYVKAKRSDLVRKQRIELEEKVAFAKTIISEGLMSLRSGKTTPRNVIREVEDFKSKSLVTHEYEQFLDSCGDIANKLALVKSYVSHGITYLGEADTLKDAMTANPSHFFVVLNTSAEMENSHAELSAKTRLHFLGLAREKKKDTTYIVCDLDLQPKASQVVEEEVNEGPKILYMRGPEIISRDLYADYVIEKQRNVARLKDGCSPELMVNRPGRRSILEITCPGFRVGSCISGKLKWSCDRCKAVIEYGFNGCFYCACGEGKAKSYEFRCANRKHGDFFIAADSTFLGEQLSNMQPSNEMNILVLGQTGVGKSTWINSIVNYMNYDSMDSAQKGGVICTIPIRFEVYDPKTFEKTEVEVGQKKLGEVLETGKSATQTCQAYTFFCRDRFVRIIDTPGIGDTRGIEKDKENMENIVDMLGYLKNIHAICILFKANESRLTAVFSYCLNELFTHLHKSAARNIIFCFTNSRNSNYGPGQTAAVLDKLLQSINIQNEVSLGPKNCFCLDNEAFLFLCTCNYSTIRYPDHLVTSFKHSWDIAVLETKRLFDEIQNWTPHKLEETLSLVKARNRIISLSKPVAEITYSIQLNIETLERKKKELENSQKTLNELETKKMVKEITLQAVELGFPRTVCTSPKCVRYVTFKYVDVREIEYVTHCHEHCHLKNIIPRTVNNRELIGCQAMVNGKCQNCGCGWENHMHITVSQKRVELENPDKEVESLLKREMTEKEKKQALVNNLQSKADQYDEELRTVLKISSEMGKFIKDNAITFYNDSTREYLNFQIQEEENKPYKSETELELLKKLKNTLKAYEAEVQILEKATQSAIGSLNMTPEIVNSLEKQLFSLPLTGKQIEQMVKVSRKTSEALFAYSEIPLNFGQIRQGEPAQDPKSARKKYFYFF